MTVDAHSAREGQPDSLDIRTAGVEVTLLNISGAEQHLVLSEGARQIHLAVRSGSLLEGPVRLRYALDGFADLETKLLTLRRLAALWRLGRMPAELFPRDTRAPRWIEMLRTIDALQAGAEQREIAEALYGSSAVREEWRGRSDYLRLRVQRLVRSSEAMVEGGYLRLVSMNEVSRR
ncbi:DUF2285 domain-containing protein [Sphingomonas sp. JC676]|uniref:DNA -binding domain-containing protein n=1 Tax=Sphingomonas sp. JC676 TaxID=2768065 RepID=UPI001657743B|nr:DUF2285 domain-containing protein [Sphingomonas sp. JC676]MBC9035138.1 DUF2285 domain-containing protein [Sphingomonas sp. JC676]